ncbi:hypothetical protein Ngar_c23100 [Candidatus Nitrososphaera gargensis Ga9.2]|uniref:Uncharacterized protein n=1 Tax=Nitrososphaera gargensis (strain Ga9.2) TaxID=1237085 RepID=K0ICZ1_NITGG|nr:hypothetical protein Ngar_c23100 [Candidatus Nitrososphaera gargensis Ga9.2]
MHKFPSLASPEVLEGSIIIDETSLEPNLSIAAEMVDLPARQQLLLSLAGNPPDVPLQARITGPNGETLVLYNVTNTLFSSTTVTVSTGNHTLEIKNAGSRPVTVSGALLISPIGQQDDGSIENDDVLHETRLKLQLFAGTLDWIITMFS